MPPLSKPSLALISSSLPLATPAASNLSYLHRQSRTRSCLPYCYPTTLLRLALSLLLTLSCLRLFSLCTIPLVHSLRSQKIYLANQSQKIHRLDRPFHRNPLSIAPRATLGTSSKQRGKKGPSPTVIACAELCSLRSLCRSRRFDRFFRQKRKHVSIRYPRFPLRSTQQNNNQLSCSSSPPEKNRKRKLTRT